jgi:hypothetical protein
MRLLLDAGADKNATGEVCVVVRVWSASGPRLEIGAFVVWFFLIDLYGLFSVFKYELYLSMCHFDREMRSRVRGRVFALSVIGDLIGSVMI